MVKREDEVFARIEKEVKGCDNGEWYEKKMKGEGWGSSDGERQGDRSSLRGLLSEIAMP
ncbi:hypothetical protein KI387_039172, partial [Taxus chinensis]